jgi:hypothetical protein
VSESAAQVAGVEGTGLRRDRARRPLRRAGGDQVDHASDGLAAPQHRLRPAQHLDARDVAGQEVAEVEAAAGRRRVVQLHPVDQHHRLVGLRPANADGGGRSLAAVAVDRDAGRLGQRVGDHHGLAPLQIGAVEHGDGGRGLRARRGRAFGGDDHRLHLRRGILRADEIGRCGCEAPSL